MSALRSITIPKEGELLKALDSEELFTNLNKFDNESDPDNEKLIAAKVKVESQCSEKIDEPSSLDKGSVDNSFTVTSYSAITSGAHNDMFASDIDEKKLNLMQMILRKISLMKSAILLTLPSQEEVQQVLSYISF